MLERTSTRKSYSKEFKESVLWELFTDFQGKKEYLVF